MGYDDDDDPVQGDGATVMAGASYDEMMRQRAEAPEEETDRTIAVPGMPEYASPPATVQGALPRPAPSYGNPHDDNPRTVALSPDQWPGMGPAGGQNSDMPRTVALPSGEFPMPDYGAAQSHGNQSYGNQASSHGNQGQSGDMPRTIALDGHASGNYPMPSGGGYPRAPQPPRLAPQPMQQAMQQAPQEEDTGLLKIVLIGAAVFVLMGGMAAAAILFFLL
jgi:hypothetical protein